MIMIIARTPPAAPIIKIIVCVSKRSVVVVVVVVGVSVRVVVVVVVVVICSVTVTKTESQAELLLQSLTINVILYTFATVNSTGSVKLVVVEFHCPEIIIEPLRRISYVPGQ